MADGTHIEWTEATWNPITGCSLASPGCTNCYAMKLAGTRLQHYESRKGLTIDTKAGPVWTGEVRFNEQWLDQPLRWKRSRMIFVCAHGDLFHESVPDEWIDRVFAVMVGSPQHTFQVLTKRASRMREYLENLPYRVRAKFGGWEEFGDYHLDGIIHSTLSEWPLPNVWLGVSVEDQARADERIPDLLATPAAVRWLSCEPLLGDLDLEDIRFSKGDGDYYGVNALTGSGHRADEDGNTDADPCEYASLDWIVVGGESGLGARPMHPRWVRSLRDQCADAGVPFFFKQWGEWGHAFHLQGCHGVSAATTGTGHWPDPKHYRIVGGPFEGRSFESHPSDHLLLRLGKKASGRLLDGVEHNGMPEVRP